MLYFPTEAPKTRELGSDINMLAEDPSLPYACVLCIEWRPKPTCAWGACFEEQKGKAKGSYSMAFNKSSCSKPQMLFALILYCTVRTIAQRTDSARSYPA
jgi:hypothetical protein